MTAMTPANQLTLLRVVLIPAFVILVIYGYLGWALVVFAIAGLTDALDGLLHGGRLRVTGVPRNHEKSGSHENAKTRKGEH